jgi:hypothetical protein
MGQAIFAGILWCMATLLVAQMTKPVLSQDSDGDGLSDRLEEDLLKQFQPNWMIGKDDCSVKPAQFVSGMTTPTVVADDGTIYGQASLYPGHKDEVELHFYHLWRQDCGEMGHSLDAEHVAVLLRKTPDSDGKLKWRAAYWYAAAHEDTVCDASQITRSTTVHAEDKGATVWVSPGKHASFLNEDLCAYGCGGDRCGDMERMKNRDVVNLGELSRPVAGATWVASRRWPLADKMRRSDFPEARLTRLERLPESDVGWANPSKRPAQAVIYGGNSAVSSIATGGRSTDTALVLANDSTGRALSKAQRNTGNALTRSYKNVVKALDGAAENTGKALGARDEKVHTSGSNPD